MAKIKRFNEMAEVAGVAIEFVSYEDRGIITNVKRDLTGEQFKQLVEGKTTFSSYMASHTPFLLAPVNEFKPEKACIEIVKNEGKIKVGQMKYDVDTNEFLCECEYMCITSDLFERMNNELTDLSSDLIDSFQIDESVIINQLNDMVDSGRIMLI